MYIIVNICVYLHIIYPPIAYFAQPPLVEGTNVISLAERVTLSHHGLDTTTNGSPSATTDWTRPPTGHSQPPRAGHDHQRVTFSHHGLDTTTNRSLSATTGWTRPPTGHSQPPRAGHDHQQVTLSHHGLDTATNGSPSATTG